MKNAAPLLLEIALCILFAVLPGVFALWPQEIMTILAYLFSCVVYPCLSLLTPLYAARRGASAFLCAAVPFPVYLLSFVLPGLPLPAVPALLTLFFSVLGANIGAEIRKRAK